jgi:serine/threonine-protein kinase
LETFKVGDVILDKYEVTAVLGKGGMGVVLAARRRELNDLVALKFLLPSLRDNPEISARFIQEARAGIRIKNEHVARVYDVGTVDGVPFIVMEHLTGHDLSATIRKRGQLPIAESADLLLQACEAVNEAHARDIVHRDLKPGNLFVTTQLDGTPFVKVLDFGISKSTATADMSVTATTAVVGSPQYMSPEQIMSAKSVDPRSDVWSLGVILYEMLTGTPPFTGDAIPAVYAAILRGTYTRPSDPRPDIPAALEQMLAEAMAIDRETRVPSVEAFAARLAPFGTEAGRGSYGRIRQLAAGTQALSERPLDPAGAETPPPFSGGGDRSATGQVTAATAESPVTTGPRPRGWRRVTVLGVVAVAAVTAVALPRWRQTRLAASSDSADGASASPTQMDAALDDAKPAESAATGPATTPPAVTGLAAAAPGGASARADEISPATRPSSTGGTSGETRRTVAAQPAGAVGCASGATAECEAACAANRPGSCEKLAESLEKGVGAPKDVARAASLYKTTCDGGSAVACNRLGALYALGDGVTKDAAKAVALYTRACDEGSATSCVNLGAMHFEGNGVPKNESLGARFFLRGCEAGEPMGCFNVSVAYGEGGGVPKDAAQSFAFADRACTKGARAGCVRTALAKIAGEGVAKDVKAGLAQLDALCARHESVGCETLAKLYTSGVGADVPADALRVREYAKKACDLGSQRYCAQDQLLSKVDTTESTAAQANAQFQTKCDAGNLAACGSLGESLLTGNGTSVDRAKGTALLEKACEGGVEGACKKLGEGGTR